MKSLLLSFFRSRWTAWYIPAVLFLLVPAAQPVFAASGLMVAPTLVELDTRNSSESILLINGDDETHSYRLSLQNFRMNENGKLEKVPEEGAGQEVFQDQFATKMLRFSPRQITLEPGEVQTVRVAFRRPVNLPAGEYRSHLLFRMLPNPQAPPSLRPGEPGKDDEASLGINISAIYGLSIPVFARVGDLTGTAEISDLKLTETEDGKPGISMIVERSGDRSLRGDLVVKADGEDIARLNNLAIYLSTPYRHLVLPFDPDKPYLGKKITVEFHETSENGGSLIARSDTVFQ
ncbi:hypothetical protein NBZ79_11230 [Sneathiella marina]|uniref:Pili assembly chaperone N-terminal domain-containing protein n=1 Tax=Sneathiella marina TaxID=2950108 RepID=A0ABY4W384_9PROT|nr:hypothetical protein [Sneathiella marina]USG59749.1 hypothetical protein NBZ79_11230 [Sneathiella marina]